jgi:ribonucleotide reductase alpha subunit
LAPRRPASQRTHTTRAQVHRIVQENREAIDAQIDYARDFDFDYFGYKTLERSYLLRAGGRIVERPQHMVSALAAAAAVAVAALVSPRL